jgi:TPR repeat protein
MRADDGLATGFGPAAKVVLRQAAAENDALTASTWCGKLAQFGQIEAARGHFRPPADGGDLAAIKVMVWLAWESGLEDDADSWLRRAAAAADPWAMYELGRSMRGPDGETGDEAMRWYRGAAEAGYALAMNDLGAILSRAGERDEAMRWYERAAEAGIPIAMNNVAIQYIMQGQRPEAERWFQRAAKVGDVNAMANLGRLKFEAGEVAGAEEWLTRAAGNGHTGAHKMLAEIRREQR